MNLTDRAVQQEEIAEALLSRIIIAIERDNDLLPRARGGGDASAAGATLLSVRAHAHATLALSLRQAEANEIARGA